MFVFTPMQSRTHVDTVRTVLEVLTDSRHIYWSHTMKGLFGSHVSFVSSSSLHVVNWSDTILLRRHECLKLCLQWMSTAFLYVIYMIRDFIFIIWFTPTSNISVLVYVMKVKNFKHTETVVAHFKRCADNLVFQCFVMLYVSTVQQNTVFRKVIHFHFLVGYILQYDTLSLKQKLGLQEWQITTMSKLAILCGRWRNYDVIFDWLKLNSKLTASKMPWATFSKLPKS